MPVNRHFDQRDETREVGAPSERSFGLTFAVVFSLLTALSVYRHGLSVTAGVLLASAAGFLAAAYLAPRVLKPLNRLWHKFGLLLHRIMNPLILGALFFLAFTPMGLVMRLFGADQLRIKPTEGRASRWIVRAEENVGPTSMKNQF